MPAFVFFFLWAAATGGTQVNSWLGAVPNSALTFEKRLFGLATGLIFLAYSVLLLGVLGFLSAVPILAAGVLLLAIGFFEHKKLLSDLFLSSTCLRKTPAGAGAFLLFIVFGASALCACFAPPIAMEWDSLCYHLADPKIYLAHHRIIYLPWESHSNFAFTMEMLYTIGLSLHSLPLAKLFHFTMGVLCIAATYLIGRRIHSAAAGLVGALLFSSLPIVFWEAGTAYVDLGAAAFGTLSLLAIVAWANNEEDSGAWLRMSAIMMAGMVSVKATSLVNEALFSVAVGIVLLLRSRSLISAFNSAFAYAAGSVAGGSVWYIKSWIVTGNPFFPFAYSIFGGKHWSKANALTYTASQAQFGMGHRPADLLLVPWNLTLYLLKPIALLSGLSRPPYNDALDNLATITPFLLAALFIPAFWTKKSSPLITGLGIYGFLSLVIWFCLTQQLRYLLPVMPVYCLLSSIVLVELSKTKVISRLFLSALYVVSLLFSSSIAVQLILNELPVATGAVSKDEYIQKRFDGYLAMMYLNQQTPKDSGVVFYGEPRDFYCDRRYMWAEPNHGLVIPYDSMRTSDDLRSWLLGHGFQYIYINYTQAAIGPGSGLNGLVYGLTAGGDSPPVYSDQHVAIFHVQ